MRQAALVYLALAPAMILVGAFVGGEAGSRLFVVAGLSFPSALIVLATARSARRRWLGAVAVVLAVVLVGSGIAVLALDRVGPVAVPPLGLPASTTVALLGLGLLPLILVGWAHGIGFDERDEG